MGDLPCNEHVCRLHVSVDDFVAVNVIESVQELFDDTLDLPEREGDLVVGQKACQHRQVWPLTQFFLLAFCSKKS